MRVEARTFWQEFQKGARRVAEVARDETVRVSRMGNLRLDIARLSRARKERCRRLGERFYDLLVRGETPSAELFKDNQAFIAELDEQMADKRAQLKELRVSRGQKAWSPGAGDGSEDEDNDDGVAGP